MSDSLTDAMAQLFRDCRSALHRYINGIVRSPADAEEIVQEAFLRTCEYGERAETPKAFLFSTARNLALSQRRHQRVARTDSVADMEALALFAPDESAESILEREEELALLRAAIERLPPRCRAAFTLRIFHGCSYKDIAGRLGMAPKTVENHVARGLRETHAWLHEHSRDAS